MTIDMEIIDLHNPHRGPAFLIGLCGARFNGIQQTATGWPNVVLFTDPVTSLTIAMNENDVTIGNVWRVLRQHRSTHFGIPQSA